MKFIIAKTLLLFSLPLSSLLLVMGAGFLLAKKLPRTGRALSAGAFLLLYMLSISPVANALLRTLESAFTPPEGSQLDGIEYVVVLGGGVTDLSWLDLRPVPSGVSLQRVVKGISIQRTIPGSKLVLSGGSGDPERPDLVEADAMKEAAISLGVPLKDIIVEGSSRNTLESVKLLKDQLVGKKVLLVTSAFHMGRAAAMFEKSGIYVVPAPAAYVSETVKLSFYSLIPGVDSLGKSSTAVYEYLARFWYGLNGAI